MSLAEREAFIWGNLLVDITYLVIVFNAANSSIQVKSRAKVQASIAIVTNNNSSVSTKPKGFKVFDLSALFIPLLVHTREFWRQLMNTGKNLSYKHQICAIAMLLLLSTGTIIFQSSSC